MCDREAQWIGELARYALRFGILEPEEIDLRGFWWVKGRCKGIRAGTLDNEQNILHITECCNQLASKAEYLDTLETRFSILDRARATRVVSLKMFPQEDARWLTFEEVKKKYGYAERTVYEWIKSGAVRKLRDDSVDKKRYGTRVLESDVDAHIKAIKALKQEQAKHMNRKRAE